MILNIVNCKQVILYKKIIFVFRVVRKINAYYNKGFKRYAGFSFRLFL